MRPGLSAIKYNARASFMLSKNNGGGDSEESKWALPLTYEEKSK